MTPLALYRYDDDDLGGEISDHVMLLGLNIGIFLTGQKIVILMRKIMLKAGSLKHYLSSIY